MESVTDSNLGEKWDRLLLLLVAQPREGWEAHFEELICRELERLAIPAHGSERDERP
jgi:hypothetical protein